MIKEYKGIKVGDRVKRTGSSSETEGTVVLIFSRDKTSYPIRVVWDSNVVSIYEYSISQIEVVSKKSKAKKAKKTKTVKHVIVKDSCNNFAGFKDNFKDSVKHLQSTQITGSYSIYKMVLVAKVSPDVKVKMIRKR